MRNEGVGITVMSLTSLGAAVSSFLGFTGTESPSEEQVFTLLRLKITLVSVTEPAANDLYHIHTWPSSTVAQTRFEASHSVQPLYLELKVGETHPDVLMDLAGGGDTPARLWFEFYCYSNSDDDDGLFAETIEGAGSLDLSKLKANQPVKVRLRDVDKHVQAVVQIAWVPQEDSEADRQAKTLSWQFNIKKPSTHLDIDPRLVGHLQAVYDSMSYNKDLQSFFTFKTYIGDLPIICFPILACSRRGGGDSSDLLLHLLRLSCASMQTSVSDVASESLTYTEMGELLGEILHWIPRCLLYVADFERGKDHKRLFVDLWWRTGCAPTLGNAGADCEDVTEQVLEMIDQLQAVDAAAGAALDVEGRALKAVRRVARMYTPFMALGTLLVGKDYEAHAHTVLLDRAYVRDLLSPPTRGTRAEYRPALTIEGTNYMSSVWDEQMFEHMEQTGLPAEFTRGESFFRAQGSSEDLFRRILRSKIPSYAFATNKVYGQVAALLTASYFAPGSTERQALHLILHTDKLEGKTMGFKTEDLLLHRATSANVTAHAQLSSRYIDHIQNVTRDLPVSYLPTVQNINTEQSKALADRIRKRRAWQTAAGETVTRLSIRKQDYSGANRQKINTAINNFRGLHADARVTSAYIQVTDSCSLCELFV